MGHAVNVGVPNRKISSIRFDDQSRWNDMGRQRLQAIAAHPERFIIRQSPTARWPAHRALWAALEPVAGRRVLELGCGCGQFAVFLAQQGALVRAVDVGPSLISAARLLAQVNQVTCDFAVTDLSELAWGAPHQYDRVIGLSVLHHLRPDVLESVMKHVARSLVHGARGVFYEPIENSAAFCFVQTLFPAGASSSSYYRPARWQRRAWKKWVAQVDDRDLTTAELVGYGRFFRAVHVQPFGCLVRLVRLFGNWSGPPLRTMDTVLFKYCPPLRYFAQSALVCYYG